MIQLHCRQVLPPHGSHAKMGGSGLIRGSRSSLFVAAFLLQIHNLIDYTTNPLTKVP
jgi:hypothetical protein